MLIREQAVFSGRVQGVGFRATCRDVAREFGLSGWVRNEADGTVQAEVQGPEDAVARFFAVVPERTFGRVDRCERGSMDALPDESGFVIR
jgi:acylphosphatase